MVDGLTYFPSKFASIKLWFETSNLFSGCRPENLYLFSSRPREARTGNKESSSKKYSAPLPMPDRHGPSSDRLLADSFDDDCVYGGEFVNSRHAKSPEPRTKHKNHGSHLKSNNLYPHSNANGSAVNSPRRQSINRKSLREIPVDELRRSGVCITFHLVCK